MTWTLADTDASIPERFELQARRAPDAIAIGGTAWEPSFAELDAAANRLADGLLERRDGMLGRVALLLRHDAPLIAAGLAVLKAGGTAAMLSPRDPPARLDRIRAEFEPELVLVDAAQRELALAAGFAGEELVEVPDRPDCSAAPAPAVERSPDDVAFLLYTSGSTGRPKGVLQTHRNLLHNALLRLVNGLELRADDRTVLLASPSGGQGLATVWSTLLNGSTLCPFPIMERGVTGLPEWLEQQRITVFTASASIFRHFARTLNGDRLEGIRLLRLGSEPALRDDFDAFSRHFAGSCSFANTFSSSETGNITQLLLAPGADPGGGGLPLGRPATGIEVLLLDERGEPAPAGAEGEIVISSRYLSPGYWRDDALTAERFGAGSADGAARLFRTGDLGRLDDEGLLRWTGRKDAQVKIRGNRVDLVEVEQALLARPEIAAAAVAPRPTARGDLKLTGYVAAQPGLDVDADGLRAALRATLPEHALPSGFAFLDSLPLTSHGKVDRERLELIEPARPGPAPADFSVSETEELLRELWAGAFERERVGREQSFFELGGDSLTAAVIAAGVQPAFGVELALGTFVEHPTPAAMAKLIEEAVSAAAPDPIPAAARSKPLPLTFAQERTWETSIDPEAAPGYTMSRRLRITGPLDVEALRRSVDRIVARHEILRTNFAERDGRPVQLIRPVGPAELPLIDLSAAPDPEAAADELVAREARSTFDLERDPLLKLLLVRLAADEHQLLRVNHHIISDGWSWTIFFSELGLLYEADVNGEPTPLADEPSLQYADYAAWERGSAAAVARRQEELAWWPAELAGHQGPVPMPSTRRRRREHAHPHDGVVWWGLRPELSSGLDALGRRAGVTFFMSRLAVFSAQLALDCGRDDLVLGSYASGRRRAETQDMFGFFSNLTTLRLRFDPELGFGDWLLRVRDSVVATSAHCETPYHHLNEALGAAGFQLPPLTTIFSVSDYPLPQRFGGLELTAMRRAMETMPWGFTWSVDRYYEADRCLTSFDPRVHDPDKVRALVARVQRLVEQICAEPARPLGELRAAPRGALARLLRRA